MRHRSLHSLPLEPLQQNCEIIYTVNSTQSHLPTLTLTVEPCLQVTSLSGGERRRLQLAAVLVEKPNLLILDEPTNDLDLQTVEVVEELLSEYKGCLLVVSHDRTFMENLADRLFVVTGDGLVRMFDGLYSEVSCCLDGICYSLAHHACEYAVDCMDCCTCWEAVACILLDVVILHAVGKLLDGAAEHACQAKNCVVQCIQVSSHVLGATDWTGLLWMLQVKDLLYRL